MIKRIKRNHTVLCTSRDYDQVTQLAKIRKLKLIIVGKHGGSERHDKLNASLHRTKLLSARIKKFSPDITISFCSPEAARVSYGLGIPHICFSDSPHATAVMKLSLPYVDNCLSLGLSQKAISRIWELTQKILFSTSQLMQHK